MRKETKVRYKEANSSLQIQILVILTIFFAFIVLLLAFLIFSSKEHFEQQIVMDQLNSSIIPAAIITTNHNHNNSLINNSKTYFRLPTIIHPLHYNLNLQIFLPYHKELNFNERNFSIYGNVAIHIICLHQTNRIILNAKNLNFNENDINVEDSDNKTIPLIGLYRYQHEMDDIHVVEIVLRHALLFDHDYMIYIKYQGVINDVWTGGLYRTQYDINGETR